MNPTTQPRAYRCYEFLMVAFVVVLLCSNFIGPGKTGELSLPIIGTLVFGIGNIFFPISYIFGDVLTEVYGYARARRVIWAGFGAMIFTTSMALVVIHFPSAADEPYNEVLQPALEVVFGNSWRIVLASIVAFWVGDFVNAYVMAKMKVWSEGKHLWMRTIGSTIVGQGADSLLFYPIAFAGIWEGATLLKVIAFNCVFKILVEVCFTPITYLVVNKLKRIEGVDHYDRDTQFTPFSLRQS